MILYFIFLILGLPCFGGAEETLVIRLSTEVELLPIFISPMLNHQSGFPKEYTKNLENILKFDFSNNGMTRIGEETLKKTQIDQAMPFDFQGDLSAWSAESIYYVIKTQIKDKKLFTRILLINGNSIKVVDGLTLTGDLANDRKVIHQLSDSIFKALFGKDGIASTKILYAVKSQDPKTKKWTSILYEADYDGANGRPVTEATDFAITPAYVPPRIGFRSNSYLFVSYKSGQPKIYFGNLQNNQLQRFSLLKGNQLLPTMSKQRDKIAFISDVTGNPDLFLQDFDTEKGALGKPRQIYATHQATQSSPTFSPDGKQLAFVSNKDGSPRIYMMDIPEPNVPLKNIKAKLVSKVNRENTAPSWSPDGSKIAYCSQVKGIRQIWLYDFATNSERQLTVGAKNKENPCFAPNSLHLIFNTSDTGDCELYLMNLNQPNALKISSGLGEKYFPAWEIILK